MLGAALSCPSLTSPFATKQDEREKDVIPYETVLLLPFSDPCKNGEGKRRDMLWAGEAVGLSIKLNRVGILVTICARGY